MSLAKALSKTSLIGIVAPASSDKFCSINSQISKFKQLGFSLKLGKHLFDKYSYLSSTDKNRADDINDMFNDKDIDAIICLRGGYGSMLTIPFIDSNSITNNPKIFCGYSDITILLNYFQSLGLTTFHGPMVNSDFSDNNTLSSFLDVLSFNNTNYTYNLNDYPDTNIISCNNDFSGKLIGGNLSMICSSIGTNFELNFDNSILLIEEINEPPYKFDRLLSQLTSNSRLNRCKGIIVGYLDKKASSNYSLLKNILLHKLIPLNIPLIINFPVGHDYPNLTIPIGCNIKYSYLFNKLIITNKFLQ